VAEPAYTRMQVDERREQLLDLGGELFARNSYEEISMARFAREAGISKALLYHYFPSKSELFEATLRKAATELQQRTEPDPELAPLEALSASLGAYLAWIEENSLAYTKLLESTGVAEVRHILSDVRAHTAARILDGLAPDGAEPKARTAVNGWLWFMDGACVDWIEHGDVDREEMRGLLLGSLLGVLTAAGAIDPAALPGGSSPG
jgi:AcrR family transcriptional regulator